MQEAQALGTQAIVLNAIIKAAGRLKEQPDPMQEAAALGALTILLPQLEEPGIPETLSDVVPNIMALLDSSAVSVQSGACAVLAAIMAASEDHWKELVCGDAIPKMVQLLITAADDLAALKINALTALTSAAQGGDAGTRAILDAGLGPVLEVCSSSSAAVTVQEAVADLCCQIASEEQHRSGLTAAGAMPCLIRLLSVDNNEVRVRVLMALGMLLPNSSDNQQQLAQDKGAVRQLCDLVSQNDDMDIKAVSRDLFAGLAKNFKEDVAAALRD